VWFLNYEGSGEAARVQVNFNKAGTKWLVMAYANLRENDNEKFLLSILTISFLIGCSDSNISDGSSQSEDKRNMNGGLLLHGLKTIQVLAWLLKE
jgi:hypothetical protein